MRAFKFGVQFCVLFNNTRNHTHSQAVQRNKSVLKEIIKKKKTMKSKKQKLLRRIEEMKKRKYVYENDLKIY